jgi:hypothetical protein
VKRAAVDTVPASAPGPSPSSPSRGVRLARKTKETSAVSPATSVTTRAMRRANHEQVMNRLASKKALSKNLEYSEEDETESE